MTTQQKVTGGVIAHWCRKSRKTKEGKTLVLKEHRLSRTGTRGVVL